MSSTDRLQQLLDEGWDHLASGDFSGAKKRAAAARADDANAPEVDVLCGAIAHGEGDLGAAKAAYYRAMELDPEFFDPILLAATVCEELGETEEAITLCRRALDAAEEEDEFVDALLTKAELELSSGDESAAAETLDELPPVAEGITFSDPVLHLRAGDLLVGVERLDEADAHFVKATADDRVAADGFYGRGLCAEAREDERAKIEQFQKVRALDLKAPKAGFSLSHAEMEEVVEAALSELPEKARGLLANVPIVVEDRPSETQVTEGLDPRLLGLFSGVPYPEQSTLAAAPHLEHITLYQRNLERAVDCVEALKEEVRVTLLHETGHFFGLDEAALEIVGLD